MCVRALCVPRRMYTIYINVPFGKCGISGDLLGKLYTTARTAPPIFLLNIIYHNKGLCFYSTIIARRDAWRPEYCAFANDIVYM